MRIIKALSGDASSEEDCEDEKKVFSSVWQCVAVCCSVLQCVVILRGGLRGGDEGVLQCVTVCGSVLLCVVVCCNVV